MYKIGKNMLKNLNFKKYIFVFTLLACVSGFLGAQTFAIELRILVNSIKQVEAATAPKANKLARIAIEIDNIAALIKAKTVDLKQYLVNVDRFRLSTELFNDLLVLIQKISEFDELYAITNYNVLMNAITVNLRTAVYNFARQQDIEEYDKFVKKFLKIANPKVVIMPTKTKDIASSSSSSTGVDTASPKLNVKIDSELVKQLAELERLRTQRETENLQRIKEEYQRQAAAILNEQQNQ